MRCSPLVLNSHSDHKFDGVTADMHKNKPVHRNKTMAQTGLVSVLPGMSIVV